MRSKKKVRVLDRLFAKHINHLGRNRKNWLTNIKKYEEIALYPRLFSVILQGYKKTVC